MSGNTIVLVTGANRGVGEAICRVLVSTIQKPLILYAASRSGSKLDINGTATTQIIFPKLDITDSASIQKLSETIKAHHDELHVLINNAGVNLDQHLSIQNTLKTLDTNYRGTLNMCQTFIPLMKKKGRIVNVSSVASSLENYSHDIQQRFRNPKMSLQDLDHMVFEYERSTERGMGQKCGWNKQPYSFSKACINALTAILAREHPGLIVNACCPGWIDTDMGNIVGSPPKVPVDGAEIPVRLGFKDIRDVSGRYWANPSISGTEDGQVMEW